jgi:DNA-binding transcriptional MerR regulator
MLTCEVAEKTGITVKKIQNILCLGVIMPPKKDRSGRYVWDEEDIKRLRKVALVDRRRKENRTREGAHVA